MDGGIFRFSLFGCNLEQAITKTIAPAVPSHQNYGYLMFLMLSTSSSSSRDQLSKAASQSLDQYSFVIHEFSYLVLAMVNISSTDSDMTSFPHSTNTSSRLHGR